MLMPQTITLLTLTLDHTWNEVSTPWEPCHVIHNLQENTYHVIHCGYIQASHLVTGPLKLFVIYSLCKVAC